MVFLKDTFSSARIGFAVFLTFTLRIALSSCAIICTIFVWICRTGSPLLRIDQRCFLWIRRVLCSSFLINSIAVCRMLDALFSIHALFVSMIRCPRNGIAPFQILRGFLTPARGINLTHSPAYGGIFEWHNTSYKVAGAVGLQCVGTSLKRGDQPRPNLVQYTIDNIIIPKRAEICHQP